MNGQTPPISTCSGCGSSVKSDYYIDPQNNHWMIYGKDTGINAKGIPGTPGESPYIGTNGNWWVGDTDTGQPAQGIVQESGPQSASELF